MVAARSDRPVGAALCPIVVGRDVESAALSRSLAAARSGRGALVCLTGEAGIGKSRLAREVAALAVGGSVPVAVGRAVPAGSGVPYRPWTEALLALLRDRPVPDAPELLPWLPALGAIVPTIAAGQAPIAADGAPAEVSAAMRGEALLRLLGRLGRDDGLVLVLEDLHWADPDTLAVLEFVADNLAAVPVLVVATARDEPANPAIELIDRLSVRRSAIRLALPRLSVEQTAVMARACLGDRPAADAHERDLAAVTAVAEGVPFLVEEVLAAPGVPAGFAASVTARLAEMATTHRRVIEAAAVLGRRFEWRLLAATADVPAAVVTAALEQAAAASLVTVEDGGFRFRHALTRDAVLDRILPPRRVELAGRALAALEAAPADTERELAAGLAEQSGDLARAADLLLASGRAALARGALDTAIATLRRIAALTAGTAWTEAARLLIEALAAAGRVDESVDVATGLITTLADRGSPAARRAAVHVRVADAAVAATRWPLAARHLTEAARLLQADPDAAISAERAVLAAEIALAGEQLDRARALAEDVLADPAAAPSVACRAWALIGRTRRLDDLAGARTAFEHALAVAETAGLAVWEVRALHELATIDLLGRADTTLLRRTRARAEALGLLSRVAVADLQLSAAAASASALDDQARHARAALSTATVLGLPQIQATALAELAEVHAIRDEPAELRATVARAVALAGDDREIHGFCVGARALHALLHGSRAEAIELFVQEADILRGGHTNPAAHRGLLPLLLAVEADPRARAALADNRREGLDRFFIHPGLLTMTEAVLAGRAGDRPRAEQLARDAEADLAPYPGWGDLTRLLAAPAARADRWGTPEDWLRTARDGFTRLGLPGPARRCAQLLDAPSDPWARFRLTARETEVLALVTEGLANKDIAARLRLSPRTVEKHLEALLRKTATRSRTHLLALALGPRPPDR